MPSWRTGETIYFSRAIKFAYNTHYHYKKLINIMFNINYLWKGKYSWTSLYFSENKTTLKFYIKWDNWIF